MNNKMKIYFSVLVLSVIALLSSFLIEKKDSPNKTFTNVQQDITTSDKRPLLKNENKEIKKDSKNISNQILKNSNELLKMSEEELVKISKNLSSEEIVTIQKTVVSIKAPNSERQAGLYLLTQAGLMAANALEEIAKSQLPLYKNSEVPHTSDSIQTSFEISLRVTALEALDNLIIQDPSLVTKMKNIERDQKNGQLKYLAQVGLAGIKSNRPGKIKRVIDAMMAERS